MPKEYLKTNAIVLSKKTSGERFFHLALLGPECGLIHAMLRRRSRKGTQSSLDLFDTIDFNLEKPGNGSSFFFVKDHEILARRSDIGTNYHTLEVAAQISSFLEANPIHEVNNHDIYRLASRAYDSLSHHSKTDAILIKALYIYSRDEGYPLKEDWFNALPELESIWAAKIINTPLAQLNLDSSKQSAVLVSLENYLQRHTEIKLGYA